MDSHANSGPQLFCNPPPLSAHTLLYIYTLSGECESRRAWLAGVFLGSLRRTSATSGCAVPVPLPEQSFTAPEFKRRRLAGCTAST
eukprot:8675390-Karenia_brevis.AAC.1